MIISDVVKFLIESGPGRTQKQLSEAIFGERDGYQQRVNWECRSLAESGQVVKKGAGVPGDPFTYFPADTQSS